MIIALIVFSGLAIAAYGLYNHSFNEPIWSFKPWLFLDMIGFTLAGVLLAYNEKQNPKRILVPLKFLSITISIYAILGGIEAIHKKIVLAHYLVYYSGTEAEYVGYFGIGAGLLFAVWSLFMKLPDKSHSPQSAFMICVTCQEPYSKQSLKISSCPKCGGMLEDLSGFYDRHPDLEDTGPSTQTAQCLPAKPKVARTQSKVHSPELEQSLHRLLGKEGLNSTKNRILVLLLPILMLILSIVIWRLFQHIMIHGFDEVKYAPGHGMFW